MGKMSIHFLGRGLVKCLAQLIPSFPIELSGPNPLLTPPSLLLLPIIYLHIPMPPSIHVPKPKRTHAHLSLSPMAISSFEINACIVYILCWVAPIFATVYTVGDASGWTSGYDYSTWTTSKTFAVGDSLVFNYGSSHTVQEVSQTDYTACNTNNAINSYTSGPTTIALKTAGTQYFICGVIGHCSSGMKVAITVGASAPASPSGTPSGPSTTTTPSPPTTTGSGRTPSSAVPQSSSVTRPSPFAAALTITWIGFLKMILS
ncbi:blue copper protein-like [Malania oleifera]|uniref:blue copper protein-like n=1 Tax=Malania oleifera TaxID=397392 RepID=UPI0025AE7B76|nr:blue copper protein-like [Malania oleifera]